MGWLAASETRSHSTCTTSRYGREETGRLVRTGAGAHRVEGVGTGVVPPLLTRDVYDEARTVDEEEARRLVPSPARQEGVCTGTSGALNITGAIRLARRAGAGRTVVTVVPDTGLKYLAGDLFAGDPS
ncbi:pyridoxal-phosphate dependent enzyme [Streptomyces dioscori]|uniref:pyridoxal-phosphate dependent enzyme n=1 Tax=Streptomyces dioscori TaxID=2109333 RepID=UPI00384E27DA